MPVSSQSGRAHRLEKPQRPTWSPTCATTWPIAVGFELLGERPLLLDVGALPVAEGAVDVRRRRRG